MKRAFLSFVIVTAGLLAAPALAQDNSIGLGVGFVDPENVGGTAWFTANAQIKVADRIVVQPEAGFWTKSEDYLGLASASIKDFNVGANVLYMPATKSDFQFGIGVGIGLHILSGEVGVLNLFSESDSETKLGIHLLGQGDYKLSDSVGVFAAVRFDLVSDINQTKVYGGVRFKI